MSASLIHNQESNPGSFNGEAYSTSEQLYTTHTDTLTLNKGELKHCCCKTYINSKGLYLAKSRTVLNAHKSKYVVLFCYTVSKDKSLRNLTINSSYMYRLIELS